jgi:hypothetical protein
MNISPGRTTVTVPPGHPRPVRRGEPPDAEAVTSAPGSVYHRFDDAESAGPMIG